MQSLNYWITLVALALSTSAHGQLLPAFPGAEGFGAAATGGRGGQVIKVTNLNASGPGSLQWALDRPGPRIVVFDVSGVIRANINVPHGDLTIAGQTAPGAGITIEGHLSTPYPTTFGNFIIRHIRVRPPVNSGRPPQQHDGIQFSANRLFILDHVDVSHGIDENVDLFEGARDITVQWSIISLPVFGGGHPDGDAHNYGLLNGPGGGRISIHHNLFAHNRNRNPALGEGPAESINNVVYNSREGFTHNNPANGEFNIIGNYFKDGPSDNVAPLWMDPENGGKQSDYFVFDNYADDPGNFLGRFDNPFTTPQFDNSYTFYCCGVTAAAFNHSAAFDFSSEQGWVPVEVTPTADNYDLVLSQAGAWPRDLVSQWVVDETRDRNGSWGNRRPENLLEGLIPGQPPQDSDDDGMPDDWEVSRGLNPQQDDSATVRPSGYTAIEEYINELADQLLGANSQLLFADGFEIS